MSVLPAWRRLKPVMFAARVLGPVFYLLLAVSSSITSMPAVGLIERALATTCVLWICALAVNLIVDSLGSPRMVESQRRGSGR
jgi:hypothetical protein